MNAKLEAIPSILCVDDEPRVVDGLALHLRKDYRVLIANSGQSALQLLKEQGAPAVVVSDMRMPGMDGAVLLKQIKNLYPDTTRILLTGEPGRDAAISAVNEAQIFRFLTKPCPPDQLRAAIDAAVSQHRLLSAERVLLQETLVGCIRTLVDILALTHPAAFGRTTRVTRLAMQLATAIGLSRDEIIVTRARVIGWTCTVSVAILSIVLALVLPFNEQQPWLFAIPGCTYWLLMFARPIIDRMALRRIAEKR